MKKKDRDVQDFRTKLARAKSSGDWHKASDICLELAQYLREHGDTEEAIEEFQSVIGLAQRARVLTDEILALRGIAEIYSEHGDELCRTFLDKYEVLVIDDPTEYQLMLTVATYCLMKIYALDERKEHLLKQAKVYAEKSLSLLKTEVMDKEKMLEKDSEPLRRTNAHRFLAEIYCYQRDEKEAEKHSVAAFEIAERRGSKDDKFEILRGRLDFPWRDKIKSSEELCKLAASMSKAKQVEAALFSAMTFFDARMVDKGTTVLLDIHEALNHTKKSGISDDDRSKYDDLLIFGYRADARNRQLQKCVREEDHAGQYRIHDKLGDLYFNAGFKEAALYHYEQALNLAESQAENENARKALISCAETASEWKKFAMAAGFFDRLAILEECMKIDPSESIACRFDMLLNAGKFDSDVKINMEIDKLEKSKTKFMHSVYSATAKYYANKGKKEEAERFENLYIDAMKSNTKEESDDDEKSEKGYDSLDEMKEDHIRNIMLKKAKDNAKKKALAKAGRKKNQYGESKLIECAREGNLADVKILVEQGADVKQTDPAGWTPLSEAVGANNLEIVKYLLTKGADPNSKSNEENGRWVDLPYHGHITPLMEACTNGFHEIAQWLLHHKAATSLVVSTNLDGWTAADFMSDYIKRAVRGEESEAAFQHNLNACKVVLEKIKQLQRKSGFPVRIGDPPAILASSDDTAKFAAEKEKTKRRAARQEKRDKGAAEDYQEAMTSIGSRSKHTDKDKKKRKSREKSEEDLFDASDDEPLVRPSSSSNSARKKRAIVLSSDSEDAEKEKSKPEKRRKSLDMDDERSFGLEDDARSSPLQSTNRGSQAKKLTGIEKMKMMQMKKQQKRGKKRSVEYGDENGVSIVPDHFEIEERFEPKETKRRRNESESSQSELGTPTRLPLDRRDSFSSIRGLSDLPSAPSPIGSLHHSDSRTSLSSASALASTGVKVILVRPGSTPDASETRETLVLSKAPSDAPIADLPKHLEAVKRAIDGGSAAWSFRGDPLDAAVMRLGDLAELYDLRVVELECRLRKTMRGEFEKRIDPSDRGLLSDLFDALNKFESSRTPTLELRNEPNYTQKTRDALWQTIEEYVREKMKEDAKWRAENVIVEQFRDVPSSALRTLIRMRPRESLSLRFCSLDDGKLEEMAEEEVSKLSTLDLSFNHSIVSCELLARTVEKFRGVHTVILQGLSGIEDGRPLMQTLGGMPLNSLNLDENPWLDDSCMEELMKGEAIGRLSTLRISKVALRTMVWMGKADALKSLKSLSLAENNGIAASGWERVAGFIRCNSSLKSLDIKATAVRPSFLEALASRSPDSPVLTVMISRCNQITPSEICRALSPLVNDEQNSTLHLKLHLEKEKVEEVNTTSPLIATRYLKAVPNQ